MKKNFKEEQREEAVRRLETLVHKFNLSENILNDYKKDIIKCTYNNMVVRNVSLDKPLSKIIARVEKEHNVVVYYCFVNTICLSSSVMTLFAMLCVSKYKEDWEFERLNFDSVGAYVENLTFKECSEFGDVGVNVRNRMLIKIW